jgi:hypothetical protein
MFSSNREYGRRDPSRWPRGILYPQKLTLTSPTSGGRSVGIVRSRTQTMEFFFYVHCWIGYSACSCHNQLPTYKQIQVTYLKQGVTEKQYDHVRYIPEQFVRLLPVFSEDHSVFSIYLHLKFTLKMEAADSYKPRYLSTRCGTEFQSTKIFLYTTLRTWNLSQY